MLIEINLLPKKERKGIAAIFVLIFVLLLLISGSIYLFLTYQSAKLELSTLDNQLQTTKQLRAIQEQKLTEINSTSTVDELTSTIDWAEKLPVSTVTLLDHLTSLLPERGFIMNINYADTGTVSLNVQFDTSRQAAYYLNSLENSEVIKQVNVRSLVTSGEELEKDNKELKDKLEKILVPRYVASYDIQLNRQALKELASKEDEQ